MKHHKLITRKPDIGQTNFQVKLDFLVRLFEQTIEFAFNISGHNKL